MSLLLALLFGAAAAAMPDDSSDMSPHETRLVVMRYGNCVVKDEQRRASEAILANISNAELMRNYPELIVPACVPLAPGQTVRMKFQGDQYRYALADALVRKELASLPAPVLDAVPRLDHREPTEPSRTDSKGRALSERKYQDALREYEQRRAFSALSLYGECVVRADPAAARSLLSTEPDSAAESAQFAAMRQSLGLCLPEGRTLSFGKLPLRGTIAVNYYRLAKAALGAAAEATK